MYYFDNAATSRVDPTVADHIYKTMKETYANPSSIHTLGQQSRYVIDEARQRIALLIGADHQSEIIFTSGGSESNNLAIKGYCLAHNNNVYGITTSIEHKSVSASFTWLKIVNNDFKFEFIPVDEKGKVNMEELTNALVFAKDSCYLQPFVSIQLANSEIGTIQSNIKEIAQLVHKHGGILHVDAVQACGDIHLNVKEIGCDMLSVSGHKFGAPKGIGFLYIKEGTMILPLISGGQQEFGMRAGTENIPYIVGLADAFEIAQNKTKGRFYPGFPLKVKRDIFIDYLKDNIPDILINGEYDGDNFSWRLANNINVSFKDINGESLLFLLAANDMYVSNGSACNAGNIKVSEVLKAIKVPKEYINGTIRITINNDLTRKEIEDAVKIIKDCVTHLRGLKA